MVGVVALRALPLMSVVIPIIGVPMLINGEPDCGCRMVAELNSGSAAMELASWLGVNCVRHKAMVATSVNGTVVPMPPRTICVFDPLTK